MPSLISHVYRFMMKRASLFNRRGRPVAERRANIERWAQRAKTPPDITVTPADAGGVPAEWVIPAGAPRDSALLYIHGGAWVICSPRTHRAMVAQLARAAGVRALSIDYRLAPEHPFPAALEDCLAAYRWLLAQGIRPQNVAIGGDSAGGNLALATLVALRDAGDPLPAAAVCLSPATDLVSNSESRRTRAQVEVLLRGLNDGTTNILDQYAPGRDPSEPLLSPLYADLRGLPPILIHVGDHEILLDDSTRFVERARAAGVDARVVVWPAMWHVFQIHAPSMPEARESLRQLGAFLHEALSKQALFKP